MSTLASSLPTTRLIGADLLKLRRRRGLVAVTSLLTVGAVVLTYGLIELFQLANPARYGPAGGIENLGHGAFLVASLGAVAAAIAGSVASVGDLEAGVYRDLVVTGRSRLALYASRIRADLPFSCRSSPRPTCLRLRPAPSLPEAVKVPEPQLIVTTGLWALLEVVFYYLLAVGIACAIGSRAYTIGIALAWQLAVSPILSSISALGIVRELVPGVALQSLAPAALGNTVRQGPHVGMSLAAIGAVLIGWTVVVQVIGARLDTTRDA